MKITLEDIERDLTEYNAYIILKYKKKKYEKELNKQRLKWNDRNDLMVQMDRLNKKLDELQNKADTLEEKYSYILEVNGRQMDIKLNMALRILKNYLIEEKEENGR
jgi:hypothetical protein